MMTEAEAKTRWCPFSRIVFPNGGGSGNRWKQSLPDDEPYALSPVPCRCIATACMAWRWEITPATAAHENEGLKGGHLVQAAGYCGLAGRP